MEIYLVRHGETEWSRSGRHTGKSDLPLLPEGEEQARLIGERLKGMQFDSVLVSPRLRARRTCELAGFGEVARVEPGLAEWDYGRYEGLTTAQIREQVADWTVFKYGAADGESVGQVTERCRKLLDGLRGKRILLFAHGHILRALAACWIGFTAAEGRCLALQPATLSLLDLERDTPVIRKWNS
jgi:broad specificity phosphatase PhoE